MNIRHRGSAPGSTICSRPGILASILLLSGCASHREVDDNRTITSGTHQAGSALDSDYFVARGATLHLDYASGGRFYVQSGGRLRGLEQGVRESVAYAEQGAGVVRRPGLQIASVRNARQAWSDRNKPMPVAADPVRTDSLRADPAVQPLPYDSGKKRGKTFLGSLLGALLGGDDDDDDDHHHRRRSRKRSVKISDSSYEKKDD